MNYRSFYATGDRVSEVGIGTWQFGGTEWGDISPAVALQTLRSAADSGVNFIDTANIYGGGRSEQIVGKFLAESGERDKFFIATKFGRNPEPGWPDNFKGDVITEQVQASLDRLGIDSLDLLQTHCLPLDELEAHDSWSALRGLKQQGRIRAFGASVETVEEGKRCLEVEGLCSLQVILNIFRQKPLESLLRDAQQANVAIIVRLPLASGLLSGKYDSTTTFPSNDHRSFNTEGQYFNVGETFAGLTFSEGLELVEALRPWVPAEYTMAQWALRWCLDHEAVTTVIPGASKPEQAISNAAASDLPPLDPQLHRQLAKFYQAEVAERIRGAY